MSRAQTNQSNETAAAEGNGRPSLSALLAEARNSRQHSFLRWPELIGLAASALMLVAVAFAYLYYLVPARTRLTSLQVERSDLQRKIREAEAGAKHQTDAQATVTEIGQSLRNFETTYLPARSAARAQIAQELTNLIVSNRVQQTGPITFAGSDPHEDLGPNQVRRANDEKDQVVFPGLTISLSVEGSYANLRRLIRDLEASRQFITIKAIELQQGGGRGSRIIQEADASPQELMNAANNLVSLDLKLGAYFQRDTSALGLTGNQPGTR